MKFLAEIITGVFAQSDVKAKRSKGIQKDKLSIYHLAKYKHFGFNFLFINSKFYIWWTLFKAQNFQFIPKALITFRFCCP